jgi:hypothetical protein
MLGHGRRHQVGAAGEAHAAIGPWVGAPNVGLPARLRPVKFCSTGGRPSSCAVVAGEGGWCWGAKGWVTGETAAGEVLLYGRTTQLLRRRRSFPPVRRHRHRRRLELLTPCPHRYLLPLARRRRN